METTHPVDGQFGREFPVDGRSVKSRVIYRTKKNRLRLRLSLLRVSRSKSATASPQNLAHTVPDLNRFTFVGVIAERVKAVFAP